MINDNDRHASDVLYEELTRSRNSSRRNNVKRLKAVCDQMEKDRVSMSIAEVARRCGDEGPAYSTISNQGSRLGEYVKLRIGEQRAILGPKTKHSTGLADTILDPLLAAQVRDNEAQARWLKRENNALRHLLKSLRPGVDIDAALAQKGKGDALPLMGLSEGISQVDPETGGTLLALMDHLICERKYVIFSERLTVNRKVVLDRRQIELYRRLCGLTDEQWTVRYGA